MPEVSIVGHLSSATGFASHSNLFVKYRLVASQQNFRLTHGEDNGQTWVAEREEDYDAPIVFNHPLEASYACTGLGGWPKLYFEIGFIDNYDHSDLCGYGFCHIPSTPGDHQVDVAVYCPRGSWSESISCYFLGGYPRYAHPETVLTGTPRFDHHCSTLGRLTLNLSVFVKGFAMLGVYFNDDEELPSLNAPKHGGASLTANNSLRASRLDNMTEVIERASAAATSLALSAGVQSEQSTAGASNTMTPTASFSSAAPIMSISTVSQSNQPVAANIAPVVSTSTFQAPSIGLAARLQSAFESESDSVVKKPTVSFASQPEVKQIPAFQSSAAQSSVAAPTMFTSMSVASTPVSVSQPAVTASAVPIPFTTPVSTATPAPSVAPIAPSVPAPSITVATSAPAPTFTASLSGFTPLSSSALPALGSLSLGNNAPLNSNLIGANNAIRPMSALPAFPPRTAAAGLNLTPLPSFNSPALGGPLKPGAGLPQLPLQPMQPMQPIKPLTINASSAQPVGVLLGAVQAKSPTKSARGKVDDDFTV